MKTWETVTEVRVCLLAVSVVKDFQKRWRGGCGEVAGSFGLSAEGCSQEWSPPLLHTSDSSDAVRQPVRDVSQSISPPLLPQESGIPPDANKMNIGKIAVSLARATSPKSISSGTSRHNWIRLAEA